MINWPDLKLPPINLWNLPMKVSEQMRTQNMDPEIIALQEESEAAKEMFETTWDYVQIALFLKIPLNEGKKITEHPSFPKPLPLDLRNNAKRWPIPVLKEWLVEQGFL